MSDSFTFGGIGDVDTREKGSGARYNVGKPDYSLMFLDHLSIFSRHIRMSEVLDYLGSFQRDGQEEHLLHAYARMIHVAETVSGLPQKNVLDPVIGVWEHGKKKYSAFNWAKGQAWSIPIACIARHFLSMIDDMNAEDEESGQPHWAHIICNIQMLMHFCEHYQEGNDLPYLAWTDEKDL